MIDTARLEREITLIYGQTGMGKSLWTKRFLKKLRRVIILDPLGEYTAQSFESAYDMVDFIKGYKTFRIKTDIVEEWPHLCDLAFHVGHLTLIAEEAQRIMPARGDLPDEFANLIYRGRHAAVSLILISQRPTTVHIASRSQWTRIVTFRQTEPSDCRWIENTCGFPEVDPSSLSRLEYFDISPHHCQKNILTV